jgi:xanthine phosphoribosyltransferase
VDDFLASGKTLLALARIVTEAQCTPVGIAIVVEKSFEGGRKKLLAKYDVPVESLVIITHLDEDRIVFADGPPPRVEI